MNWLAIGVLIFLGFYIWRGFHNGFIKTVVSIFAVLIAIIVASIASPYMSKALQNTDKIYSFVEEKVDHVIDLEENETGYGQSDIINHLPLPNSIREALTENNNTVVYQLFHVDNLEDYIVKYISCTILNAVSYMIVFLATLIIIKLIAGILDLISKLPVLNGINKIGGIVVGLLHGLVIVWILCIVVTIFSGTQIGEMIFSAINESVLLSYIYNNNLLIGVIADVAKSLLMVV